MEGPAAEAHLLVEAKLGHLNFIMQPGAVRDVQTSDGSAAVGGEESVCSMSLNSRDCNIERPTLCLQTAPASREAAAGQHRHSQRSVGRQPASHAPESAAVSQHISGAREHSSMGCCQAAAKPAVEQSSLSSEKLSTHPCEVSRREIHVDAGYGNLAAIPEIGAAWLPETETGTTARNDSPAGPGPLSTAEPTR